MWTDRALRVPGALDEHIASGRLTLTLRTREHHADRMRPDIRSLFRLEAGPWDELDSFLSDRLFQGNVWKSPRQSDGIRDIRVVESTVDRMSICGRIFEIDQTLHSFWLDLEQTSHGANVKWTLRFDVGATSARRERNAIDITNRAEDLDWRVELRGTGEIVGGRLIAGD